MWYSSRSNHYTESYEYLNVNNIEILQIKSCPIHMAQSTITSVHHNGRQASSKVSNIRRTKSQNLNASRLIL